MGETRQFPTTDWSLLARSIYRGPDGTRSLEEVTSLYAPAMRRYLLIVKRVRLQDVEDLLQAFIVDKLVSRSLLECARHERGRFRSLLVTALENFLISRRRAHKVRANVETQLSIQDMDHDPSDQASDPAAAFDRQWAESILTEALGRTCAHFARTGQHRVWHVFDRRIVGPLLNGTVPTSYSELIREFEFATPHHAANALTTAKRAFDRELRQVLVERSPFGVNVEEELRDLLRIFAAA